MGRAAFLLLLPRVGEAALLRGPGARWGDGSDERGEERKTREGGKRKGSIESLQFFFPEESHQTFFPRKISPNLFSPKNLTVLFFPEKSHQTSRQKKRSHRTSSAAPARPPLARSTPRPSAPCASLPAGTSWICHWRALRTFSKRARRRRRAAAAQPRRRRRHSIFALCARGPPRCSTRGGHCSRTARPRRRRSWPRPRSGRGPRKRGPRRRRRRCESS